MTGSLYIMVYEIIPTQLGSIYCPLYILNNKVFFIALNGDWGIHQHHPQKSQKSKQKRITTGSSWWFQPIWKVLHSQIGNLPQFSGWKFQKIFELPPPRDPPFLRDPSLNIINHTLPETNSSHLKIDHWKRRFLLETIIFRGCVSFREGIWSKKWSKFITKGQGDPTPHFGQSLHWMCPLKTSQNRWLFNLVHPPKKGHVAICSKYGIFATISNKNQPLT